MTSKHQGGFTLLEVIVALAVMALAVTVLLRIFSAATVSTQLTDDYFIAVQIAESQMSELLAQQDFQTRDTGLVDDKFRWESSVSEYHPKGDDPLFADAALLDPETTYRPYFYEVTVSWGVRKKRQFVLQTVRLGAAK